MLNKSTPILWACVFITVLAAQNARLDKGVQGSILGGHGAVVGVKSDWFRPENEEKVKNLLVQ